MRNHSEIVKERGATNLVRDLDGKGVKVSASTPQRWADRNSIPQEYWSVIADLGLSTLEELAAGADIRADAQHGEAA